ncbi:hypothetical protein [Blastopirellula marina]|uniref:Uncharacterized protein n=1 Tax=Blastopirellula marina TaxID=124 RepID=A0A2S8G2M9_9BACT|nr:hypothetical protein [Blastopirellula marina]PQO38560.1 hypothetical protein C5Y98_10960 [Blastopirellula marina]PTL45217.1 hypothetical protein C5Y97_10970 [Blastopirellula marina]
MSKKRRSPKKLARSEAHAPPSESQAIESLTIFWSLCIFATLVFVIGVLLMWFSIAIWQLAGGPKDTLRAFADLLLFTSVVTGSVGGLLTPIVQSRRKRRAPKSLQIAAVAIAMAPWMLLALLLSRR